MGDKIEYRDVINHKILTTVKNEDGETLWAYTNQRMGQTYFLKVEECLKQWGFTCYMGTKRVVKRYKDEDIILGKGLSLAGTRLFDVYNKICISKVGLIILNDYTTLHFPILVLGENGYAVTAHQESNGSIIPSVYDVVTVEHLKFFMNNDIGQEKKAIIMAKKGCF